MGTHTDYATGVAAVPHTTASTHVDTATTYGPTGQHEVYDVYGKVKWKKTAIEPGLKNKLFGPKEYRPVYKHVQAVPRTVTEFGYQTTAVPHTVAQTHVDAMPVTTAVPHTTVGGMVHTTEWRAY
eukprot:NODE_3013_length_505_cov_190.629386_g2550_i2.p2 GENE.NODE_3013_length_505_cov_190.629386_g2550_i2~~NODE_3013_length_505_cov_190.629386_g2550_i2.p2  ORF type:complete len:133 (+),score=30.83 NODE_3013_length_505_cov_190.629386_g2550_i2:27-401(+)